jgi:hypothetical protein
MRSPHPSNQAAAALPRKSLVGDQYERCLYCHGLRITREGKRYKKLETIQLWHCHDCDRVFTPQIAKGKTFPLAVILDALTRYYHGDTRQQVATRLKERFGLTLSPRTLSQWLAEYRSLTTYARLRTTLLSQFRPHQLIRSTRLHHQQVYHYRIHRGKLAYLLSQDERQAFRPIETYLTEMATSCPHPLFLQEHRASASASGFDLTGVAITEKRNLAPRIAGLVLQTVTHNKRRHDTLQRFMLATDSVTVAIEVPVYLTPEDIAYMQQDLGFAIPLSPETTLTGHIDLLQIRNGRVHILDYKPNAVRDKPITQLMVYALALFRRTGLRLYDFVCAWFDERDYFEF